MPIRTSARIAALALSFLLLSGCAGQTIVLLPDLNGKVGQITVTDTKGETVRLDKANQAVKGENTVTVLSPQQVEATFGEALAAQPEPTAKFILYFLNDSITLTKPSVKLFPEIMRTYAARHSTDVSVIGHSDAMGDKDYNYRLSVRRAEKIKAMLVKDGMNAEDIQTISHGEENPLIPTPDGKPEPRNRRVEVRIR